MPQENQLYRTSQTLFEKTQNPLIPDNHDVRAAADKTFLVNGHTMSNWLPADKDEPLFWHCMCLTCGAMGFARWRTSVKNRPDEVVYSPSFGGLAFNKSERQMRGADAQSAQQSFTARSGREAFGA